MTDSATSVSNVRSLLYLKSYHRKLTIVNMSTYSLFEMVMYVWSQHSTETLLRLVEQCYRHWYLRLSEEAAISGTLHRETKHTELVEHSSSHGIFLSEYLLCRYLKRGLDVTDLMTHTPQLRPCEHRAG